MTDLVPPAGALALAEALISFNEDGPAGPRLRAYLDKGGKPTIGTGCTRLNGRPVTLGMTITLAQARAALAFELRQTEAVLARAVRVPIDAGQYAGLASLGFNIGGAGFTGSTLLRLLNRGDSLGAAAHFAEWNLVHGVVDAGLVVRRRRERAVFLGLNVPELAAAQAAARAAAATTPNT